MFERMAQDSNLTPEPGANRFPDEPCRPDTFTIQRNRQTSEEGGRFERHAREGTSWFRSRLRNPYTFTFHARNQDGRR